MRRRTSAVLSSTGYFLVPVANGGELPAVYRASVSLDLTLLIGSTARTTPSRRMCSKGKPPAPRATM